MPYRLICYKSRECFFITGEFEWKNKIFWPGSPKVDQVLGQGELASAMQSLPRRLVVEAVRRVLEGLRQRVMAEDALNERELSLERVAARSKDEAYRLARPSLRRVVKRHRGGGAHQFRTFPFASGGPGSAGRPKQHLHQFGIRSGGGQKGQPVCPRGRHFEGAHRGRSRLGGEQQRGGGVSEPADLGGPARRSS